MPHHILIVDDDPDTRNQLESFLGKTLNYTVRVACNGETAVDEAMRQRFDLCLLGVSLPDLSGSEVFMRLKNLQPNIETLFMTGHQDFERTKDFTRFQLPPDRVLSKPVKDLSELMRLIIGILGPPTP